MYIHEMTPMAVFQLSDDDDDYPTECGMDSSLQHGQMFKLFCEIYDNDASGMLTTYFKVFKAEFEQGMLNIMFQKVGCGRMFYQTFQVDDRHDGFISCMSPPGGWY